MLIYYIFMNMCLLFMVQHLHHHGSGLHFSVLSPVWGYNYTESLDTPYFITGRESRETFLLAKYKNNVDYKS